MKFSFSKAIQQFSTYQILSFFLLLLFPVLSVHNNNYTIIIAFALAIIALFAQRKEGIVNPLFDSLLLPALFLVVFITLLYSSDKTVGLFELEKRLCLIFFPIIILLRRKPLTTNFRMRFEIVLIGIIIIFYTTTNVLIALKLKEALQKGILEGSWYSVLMESGSYYLYRTYFSILTNTHPTYAAIYTMFSSGIIVISLLTQGDNLIKRFKYLFIAILVLLLIYSFLLAAKGPIIAFLIALLFSLYLCMKRKQFLISSSVIILLFAASVLAIPTIKNRVIELIHPNITQQISSVSIRKIIHHCSIEQIKDNWLMGVGVGDTQNTLNSCYKSFNEEKLNIEKYNTHNEYFNMWLSAGIPGIITFLLMLIIPLIKAMRQKNYHFIFFIVFMSICFFTENILSRQKGVLFFTIFYLIYLYHQADSAHVINQSNSTNS